MRTPWTLDFEERTELKKLQTIVKICELETHNSVTKDDLLFLLRWLAKETIEEADR